MQPEPPPVAALPSAPPQSTVRARVVPVAGSRLNGPIELASVPVPGGSRSLGKVIGAATTGLVVLAMGVAAVKIIVAPAGRPSGSNTTAMQRSLAAGPSSAIRRTSPRPQDASATPSATAPIEADPSGVNMPTGDIPGWHQTFADDFARGLDANWAAYTGQPGGDPGGWFDASHVSVSNGMLQIGAWKADSPNGNVYISGGVSNARVFSQTYGRYIVRFQMDVGYGIAYTMQLWPTNDQWPPEIDILEDNAKGRDMTSATLHYGSDDRMLHREVKGEFTGWHTAEVEWAPGHLTYRLDGTVWAAMTSGYVPSTPMSIAIQTQAWPCGNTWEGCPNATTPDRVNLHVDWVVAYSAMR
jgi:beta-glucanase (GH16 family)